jgi:hypothetical protein
MFSASITCLTNQFGMAAQDSRADGMECAKPLHPFDAAADQRADALLHLARRLVGEGDAEDLAGPGAARGKDMGEPRGQNARLACAGAGQHQHRAIERKHSFALLGIEAAQIKRVDERPRGRPLRRRCGPALGRRRGVGLEGRVQGVGVGI